MDIESLQHHIRHFLKIDLYERIAGETGPYLRKGGAIVLEVGNAQEVRVAELLEAQGFGAITMVPDLTGAVRGVVAWKE